MALSWCWLITTVSVSYFWLRKFWTAFCIKVVVVLNMIGWSSLRTFVCYSSSSKADNEILSIWNKFRPFFSKINTKYYFRENCWLCVFFAKKPSCFVSYVSVTFDELFYLFCLCLCYRLFFQVFCDLENKSNWNVKEHSFIFVFWNL